MPKNSKITALIILTVLTLSSITYGFFIEETVWFFLGSSKYYLNDGILFSRGFLIILAPSFLIFAALFGHCADRFGDKRMILICLVLLILSCTLLYPAMQHENLVQIVLAHFLFGFGMCSLPILYAALFRISSNSQTRLIYVLLAVLCSHAFFIIGIIIHDYGILNFSHLEINTLIISVLIASILLTLYLKPPTENKSKTITHHPFSRQVTRLMVSTKFKSTFLLAGLIIFAHALFIESPHQHSSLLTSDHKNDYDLFMSISYAVMLLGAFTLIFLKKHFKEMRYVLIIGALLIILGCLGELLTNTRIYFWSFGILSSFGFGLLSLILFYGSFSAGTRFSGITMGLYLSLWALAMAFANITISLLSIYFNHMEILNILRVIITLIMLNLSYIVYKAIFKKKECQR